MSRDLRKRFGTNLRAMRLSHHLTQEDLAEKCELSVDAIRRIEWGTISPSLDTLSKLGHGLNISLSTLFQTYDHGKPAHLMELTDQLSTRSRKELLMVTRLIKILFEP